MHAVHRMILCATCRPAPRLYRAHTLQWGQPAIDQRRGAADRAALQPRSRQDELSLVPPTATRYQQTSPFLPPLHDGSYTVALRELVVQSDVPPGGEWDALWTTGGGLAPPASFDALREPPSWVGATPMLAQGRWIRTGSQANDGGSQCRWCSWIGSGMAIRSRSMIPPGDCPRPSQLDASDLRASLQRPPPSLSPGDSRRTTAFRAEQTGRAWAAVC